MNYYLKLFILCFVPILMDCSGSQVEEINIPEEIRNLENLTVYQRPENPDTLILRREQAFGDTDSILIGRIQYVAVDSSGRVFIADIQKQTINVYGPDGGFITQLGREGKGPSEFSIIRSLHIRKDRLYVYDPSQYQVSIFMLGTLAGENTIFLAENRGDYQALNRSFPWISNLYVKNNHTYLAGFIIHPVSREFQPWQNVGYKILFYLLDKAGNIASPKLF